MIEHLLHQQKDINPEIPIWLILEVVESLFYLVMEVDLNREILITSLFYLSLFYYPRCALVSYEGLMNLRYHKASSIPCKDTWSLSKFQLLFFYCVSFLLIHHYLSCIKVWKSLKFVIKHHFILNKGFSITKANISSHYALLQTLSRNLLFHQIWSFYLR